MLSLTSAFTVITALFLVQPESEKDSAFLLLPADNELNDWFIQDTPQYILSDSWNDLFPSMVPVFSEYGLKGLLMASFADKMNHTIYAEIYHMNDYGGAYGLFSISREATGKLAGYGDESYLEDTCIYLWKGNYYVKIYSFDEDPVIQEGIIRIASAIDKKIGKEGIRPGIINLLPEEGFVTERTRYFRGSAGLSYLLPFGHDDISGFREGVYGDFGPYQLLIMDYENKENKIAWNEKISQSLDNNKRYHKLPLNENYIYFRDNEENIIVFGGLGKYIMVFIGKDDTMQPEIFEGIEDAILRD